MDWLPKQCSKHKWAPKTYESNLSTIQNLIVPYIGSMEMVRQEDAVLVLFRMREVVLRSSLSGNTLMMQPSST